MGFKVPTSGQDALDMAAAYAPWKSSTAWWVILIQGIVLAVIGVVILLDRSSAVNIILIGGSIYLLISSIIRGLGIIRRSEARKGTPLALIRVGVGLAVSLIVLVLVLVLDRNDISNVRLMAGILGFGLAIEGVLSLIRVVFFRDEGQKLRIAAILGAAMSLVLGILIFLMIGNAAIIDLIAWITLIGGIAVFVLAILRYNKLKESSAGAEAASTTTMPPNG